jgi:hypothetical protein
MFGFVKKTVNAIGKAAGSVLGRVGLDHVIDRLAPIVARIPGIGDWAGAALKALPEVLRGEADFGDLIRLGSVLLPPPAGAIANLADLASTVEGIADRFGPFEANTVARGNVLALAQRAAFDLLDAGR